MTSINIRKLSHSEMDLYRKPLLPETWSCFPVDKDIDTQQLRKILQRDLDRIRSGAEKDPFSNSITMLALDISRRLEKNLLNYSALEALIQRLAVGSVGLRADRLKSYIGSSNKKNNDEKIFNLIKTKYKLFTNGISLVKSSSLYVTKSWPNSKFPDFINAVLFVRTNLSLTQLFKQIKLIEKSLDSKIDFDSIDNANAYYSERYGWTLRKN